MVKKPEVSPLAMLLHEIRAPLGLVTMAAGAAAESTSDDQVRRQCLAIIRNTNRMLRVTSNLSALAPPPEGQTFDPAQVVRAVCDDIAGLGVPLNLHTDDDGQGREAKGSAVQFEGLLQSLLMNAIDHGCTGEPIAIRSVASPCTLQISITNQLSGVPRHSEAGLGNVIASHLAEALSCKIERFVTSTSYQVALTLPVC